MKVITVRKGGSSKVVTLSGVTEVNDSALTEAAMTEANETRGSLFGTNVAYFPEYDEVTDEELETMTVVVTLWTD